MTSRRLVLRQPEGKSETKGGCLCRVPVLLRQLTQDLSERVSNSVSLDNLEAVLGTLLTTQIRPTNISLNLPGYSGGLTLVSVGAIYKLSQLMARVVLNCGTPASTRGAGHSVCRTLQLFLTVQLFMYAHTTLYNLFYQSRADRAEQISIGTNYALDVIRAQFTQFKDRVLLTLPKKSLGENAELARSLLATELDASFVRLFTNGQKLFNLSLLEPLSELAQQISAVRSSLIPEVISSAYTGFMRAVSDGLNFFTQSRRTQKALGEAAMQSAVALTDSRVNGVLEPTPAQAGNQVMGQTLGQLLGGEKVAVRAAAEEKGGGPTGLTRQVLYEVFAVAVDPERLLHHVESLDVVTLLCKMEAGV